MEPSTIIPSGPVADCEVSFGIPIESDHRRHRHAPLLQATEWMKSLCRKPIPNFSKPLPRPDTQMKLVADPVPIESGDGKPKLPTKSDRRREAGIWDSKFVLPYAILTPTLSISETPERNVPTIQLQQSLPAVPNKRGMGSPLIDYDHIDKYTALNSHPPSEDELMYTVWLGKRFGRGQNRVEFTMVNKCQSMDNLRGMDSNSRAARHLFSGGAKKMPTRSG